MRLSTTLAACVALAWPVAAASLTPQADGAPRASSGRVPAGASAGASIRVLRVANVDLRQVDGQAARRH